MDQLYTNALFHWEIQAKSQWHLKSQFPDHSFKKAESKASFWVKKSCWKRLSFSHNCSIQPCYWDAVRNGFAVIPVQHSSHVSGPRGFSSFVFCLQNSGCQITVHAVYPEKEPEPRQVKIHKALPKSHNILSGDLSCHQQQNTACSTLGGKENSHKSLKILVPPVVTNSVLELELVCNHI